MTNISNSLSAIIEGLKDGGCEFVTNVPGSNSQVIFSELGGHTISTNEKIAFEMAFGASLAGKRSVVTLKGTGLSAAADPFLHSILMGVQGGLVIVLIEDIEAISSPERQDSRALRDIFGGLWLEPISVADAYDYGYNSFEWSETLDIPIVIRLTNQFFDLTGEFSKKPSQKSKRGISDNREKYISYWKERDERLQEKKVEIQRFVEDEKLLTKNYHSDSEKTAIVIGNCQKELAENGYLEANRLHLTSYPLPHKAITNFSKGKSDLTVFEQGNNYAQTVIKTILYPENACRILSNSGNTPDLSTQWNVWDTTEKLFSALASIKPSFVVGDEGRFTDESTKTIDVCLCMGSSIGITMGLSEAGISYPFCVTGDGSFLHGGIQALGEALNRGSKFGIIVIDNEGMQSTGGQQLAADIYAIDDQITQSKINYNTTSLNEMKEILSNMKKTNKLSILYVKTV